MKTNKVDFSKMSKTDLIETAETLRASHTLLRMAFGIAAMFFDGSEDDAKALQSSFDSTFKCISDVANRIYKQVESLPKDSNDTANSCA